MEDLRIESNDRFNENIFTKAVKAGKRTYYFDVKESKTGEQYVTVTERKRRYKADGTYKIEKHKIFLYQEDFESFADALDDIIEFIKTGERRNNTQKVAPSEEHSMEHEDDLINEIEDYSVGSYEELEF